MNTELQDAEEFLEEKIVNTQKSKLDHYAKAGRMWFDSPHSTEEEIGSIYMGKDFGIEYLRGNILYHLDEERKVVENVIIVYCKSSTQKLKIVDFGCGTANILFKLEERHELHAFDLISVPFKFAQWRAKKYKKKIKFHERTPEEEFSLIICLDVLEHLKHPWDVIKYFKETMGRDSYLYLNWAPPPKAKVLEGMKPMEINYCPDDFWVGMHELGFVLIRFDLEIAGDKYAACLWRLKRDDDDEKV